MKKIKLSDSMLEFMNLVDGYVYKKGDDIIPVRQINTTFYIQDINGDKNSFYVISTGEMLNILVQNLYDHEKKEVLTEEDK